MLDVRLAMWFNWMTLFGCLFVRPTGNSYLILSGTRSSLALAIRLLSRLVIARHLKGQKFRVFLCSRIKVVHRSKRRVTDAPW